MTTDEISAIRNVCVLHDHTIATIDDEIACVSLTNTVNEQHLLFLHL